MVTKMRPPGPKGPGGRIFVTIFPLHPFISPPKAPGFRAEWAPLGPFLLGGVVWGPMKTGARPNPFRVTLKG